MIHNHACPRCRMNIAEDRRKATIVVCDSCGFVLSANQVTIEKGTEKRNLQLIAGLSIAMMIVLTQLGSWGSYALEIRWLQFRDLIGMGSIASYERTISICRELKKMDCVEYALSRQAQIEPKNKIRLAEFQMSRNKFSDAAKTLKTYVSSSKQDSTAGLIYAKALGESGQIDEAARVYENLLSGKNKKSTNGVAESYVKQLAHAKRYQQAQNVILKLRKDLKKPNYMDSEYRILAELGKVPRRSIAMASPPRVARRR